MAVAGFLLVIAGVGGLMAHRFVDLDPRQLDNITGASWAAVVVGALLVLTRAARGAFGPGVFPLAVGVTALAAQPATHWLDAPGEWRPVVELLLAVLIVGGAGWVVAELRHTDDDSAVGSLLLVAVASLVADIVVDFGRWDGAMNVLTAVAAAGFGVGCVIGLTSVVDLFEGPERGRTIAAYEPGWQHPLVWYVPMWGARLASIGIGVTAVLVTAMAALSLPTWVDVLLTLPAVLGVYVMVPFVAYMWLMKVIGPERILRMGFDGPAEIFDGRRKLVVELLTVLGTGYLAAVALTVIIAFGPPGWLAALLALAAVAAAVVGAWYAVRAFPEVLAGAIRVSEAPERHAPAVADLLGPLARGGAVYRLLPGSEQLAPRVT